MDLNSFREKYPQYSDISDDTLINSLHKKYYSDIPIEEFTQKVQSQTPSEPTDITENAQEELKTKQPEEASSLARRYIADPALSLTQGIVGLGEAAVGIADIPTMGYAGKATDFVSEKVFGGTSKDLQNYLQTFKTPEQIAQEHEVMKAKGFTGTLGALKDNPAAIVDLVAQSLPQMLGGIGVARYAIAKGVPFIASQGGANYIRAAALGEGTIAAGATAEQIRQQTEDGLLTPAQSGTALGSGVLTSMFGVIGGKVSNKLGVDDFEVIGAKLGQKDFGTDEKVKSVLTNSFKAAIVESAFEELPQSMQEQIAQNIALGKPWDEGVAESAAEGAVAGFVVAGGITGPRTFRKNREIERLEKERIENEKNTEKETEETVEESDEDVKEPSVEQIKAQEFKNLEEKVELEKQQQEVEAAPEEKQPSVVTSPTVLTADKLKSIGLRPNSKAYKDLLDKDLADPAIQTKFNDYLEKSSAKINEEATSAILEEAALSQQAYQALDKEQGQDDRRTDPTDTRTDRTSDEVSERPRDAVPETVSKPKRSRVPRGTDNVRINRERKRAKSAALKAGYTQKQLDQMKELGYEPFEETKPDGSKTIGIRQIEVPDVPETKQSKIKVTTPEQKEETPEERDERLFGEPDVVFGGPTEPVESYNPATNEVTPIEKPTEPKVTTSTIEDQIDTYINKNKAGINLNQLARKLKISPSNTTPLFTAAEQSGRYDVVTENNIKKLKPKEVNLANDAEAATTDQQLKEIMKKVDVNDVNALETLSNIVRNPNSSPSTRTKVSEKYNVAYEIAKPKAKELAEKPEEFHRKSFLDEFLEIAAEAEQEVIARDANRLNEDELFSLNEQSQADQEVVEATRKATNLKEALEILKNDFADRLSKPAKFVIDKLLATKNIQTTVYRVDTPSDPDANGAYSQSNNRVTINPNKGTIQTIIHEAVHAATAGKIRQERGKGTALGKRLTKLLETARLRDVGNNFTIKDELEFIAEVFSNPEYQTFLAKQPGETTARTLWNDFVNFVKELFGFGNNVSPNLMNDIVAVAPELFVGPPKNVFGRVEPGRVDDTLYSKDIENNTERKQKADELVNKSKTKMDPKDPNQSFTSAADELENRAKKRKGWKRTLDKFETNFFSFDSAISNAIRREVEKTGDWDEFKRQMTEISLSQTVHLDNLANKYLEDGDIFYDTESLKFFTREGDMSWQKLMDKIKQFAADRGITFEEMEQYAHTYLVAFREESIRKANDKLRQKVVQRLRKGDKAGAKRIWNAGYKYPRMSTKEIRDGLKIKEVYPEVTEIWNGWNYMRKNIINFLQDSGLYSKDEASALEDIIAYVPFYRTEQIEAGEGPAEYGRGLLITGEKLFKGSKKPVNNVFDNMERWITYSIVRGGKNKSAVLLKNAAVKYLPEQVRKLKYKQKGVRNNTVTIHENVTVNGNEKNVANRYEFEDPLYLKAFTGVESFAIGSMPFMVKASQWVRNSIILQPIFTASQISQDAIGAVGYSGAKNPLMIPIDVLTEVIRTATGTSSIRKELKRTGVVGGSEYMSVSAREDAAIRAGLAKGDWRSMVLKPFRALSSASDNVIRQGIYKRIMKETGDKARALEAAFEIINFRRSGSNQTINTLKQTVPFLGAYLQALNVMYKVATSPFTGKGVTYESKQKLRNSLFNAVVSGWILTALYQSLAADDDDYKETDPVIRNRRLIIPGTGFSIPLRPDLFTLVAKILPETLLNRYKDGTIDDAKMYKTFKDSVANALLGPTPVPQLFRPALALAFNYDPMTGRPVIGQGISNLDPNLQRTLRTTQAAKTYGDLLETLGNPGGFGSPVAFDYFMNNFTGSMYQMFNMFANPLLADMRGDVLPARDWRSAVRQDLPSAGMFIMEDYPSSKLRNDFYELRDLTSRAYASYKSLAKARVPKGREYRNELQRLIQLNRAMDSISSYLGILRNQRKGIIDNKDLGPETKQKLLREIDVREKATLERAIRQLKYREKAGL